MRQILKYTNLTTHWSFKSCHKSCHFNINCSRHHHHHHRNHIKPLSPLSLKSLYLQDFMSEIQSVLSSNAAELLEMLVDRGGLRPQLHVVVVAQNLS